MIRLLIRVDDAGMAANVGGAVLTTYRTFDVVLPEVEAVLTGGGRGFDGTYSHAQVVGAEVLTPSDGAPARHEGGLRDERSTVLPDTTPPSEGGAS